MLPLWSSYLVKVYAWKLILAKEGIISWLAGELHLTWALDALLAIPVIGGPSLSISFLGTFLVFVYVWLPFMILPTQAALERVPVSFIDASSDLGGTPAQTFRHVIFPLALPVLPVPSSPSRSLSATTSSRKSLEIPAISSARQFIPCRERQATSRLLPHRSAHRDRRFYLAIAKRMGALRCALKVRHCS